MVNLSGKYIFSPNMSKKPQLSPFKGTPLNPKYENIKKSFYLHRSPVALKTERSAKDN
jgi:hypothetical protein